jgi:dTDP-glucose pyrophosphorylase
MEVVVPCAGHSSRMHYVPKHLVEINGKPLFQHAIDAWKGVADLFVFVIRKDQHYLLPYLPRNSVVVFQEEPLGLADAILQAEPAIKDKFVVHLGDCLVRGTFQVNGCQLGIGVWNTYDRDEVNKSYSVEGYGKHLLLVEKPSIPDQIPGPYACGMGIYFLDRQVFKYIRNYEGPTGGGDFTQVLQNMIASGLDVKPVPFTGAYINVGSPEDLIKAEELLK